MKSFARPDYKIGNTYPIYNRPSDALSGVPLDRQNIKNKSLSAEEVEGYKNTQLFRENTPNAYYGTKGFLIRPSELYYLMKGENKKSAIMGGALGTYVPDPPPAGYPSILFMHPNEYSANPNQIMLYTTESKFLRSDIYEKYKDDFVVKLQKLKGYQSEQTSDFAGAKVLPHKDYRIIFRSMNKNNTTQYVLDCDDVDVYCDVLDMAKSSGFIIPVEVASKKFMDESRKDVANEIKELLKYYSEGYERKTQEIEAEKAQTEGFWNTLGSLVGVGVGIAKLLA